MDVKSENSTLRRTARPWQPAELAEEAQHRFLEALLHAGTLDEACRRTGVTRGVALAARARDAMFALQWDRINDMRLAEIESLLLEKTVQGLAEGMEAGGAQAKFVAGLGQWFLEARTPGRYGKGKQPEGKRPEGKQPEERAATEAGAPASRVAALLARTSARLDAVEKEGRGEEEDQGRVRA